MKDFLGWEPRFSDLLTEASAPIYLQTGHRRLRPLGSGVFLALGDRRFLATAAHVADDLVKGTPAIGFAERVATLDLRFLKTKVPTGGRKVDDLDVAIAEIDPVELATQGLTAVPSNAFDVSEGEFDDDIFVVAGYPFTKQNPRIIKDKIEALLYRSAATAFAPAVDDRVGRVVHLNLSFDRRRLFVAGDQVTGPALHGMSGGGIWRVDETSRQMRLAAILTDFFESDRRIRGTRLWLVLGGIWNQHPELRYLIPNWPSV